ncbi:MAG: hypothetical protein IJJ77_05665 [Paludibacteraceae bacterium]|nr:hypothetical protein [Paludibacteraceae bacterium]
MYHIFNPESDLALSVGEKVYNPPKAILRFSEDLSLLPLWYANPSDWVLTRTVVPTDWMREVREKLSVDVTWLSWEEYKRQSVPSDILSPWGWNYSLYNRWKKESASRQIVDCVKFRELSSRTSTREVLSLPYIKDNILSPSFVTPVILTSWEETQSFVQSHGRVVCKAPWSSSGKGLCWMENESPSVMKRWFENLVEKQGFVMGEKAYNKVMDFAMEFCSENGQVSFLGYSFFQTDNGKYKGNLLASDEWMEAQLTQYVEQSLIKGLIESLCAYFTKRVAPYYKGCFGVDMMVIEEEGGHYLHPCVEVNLRMNMGVVSHVLYERYVAPDCRGNFFVNSFPSHEALHSFHTTMQKNHPLIIEKGRVKQGYLPLTYLSDESLSMAGMTVD